MSTDQVAVTLVETPYFPGTELPGRVGVYKRRAHLATADRPADSERYEFSYWDGSYWHNGGATPDEALLEPMIKSHFQAGMWEDFEWCGLVPAEDIATMADADGVIDSAKSDPVAEGVSVDSFFGQGDAPEQAASKFFDAEQPVVDPIDSFFGGAQ